MKAEVTISLFTKPRKAETMDLHRLGEFVAKLGFQGVELPVTFLFDEPSSAKYLRTRFFVGVRDAAPPTVAPTDVQRVANLFAALDEARRDRPITLLGPPRQGRARDGLDGGRQH